jgi:hypothetical protein
MLHEIIHQFEENFGDLLGINFLNAKKQHFITYKLNTTWGRGSMHVINCWHASRVTLLVLTMTNIIHNSIITVENNDYAQ